MEDRTGYPSVDKPWLKFYSEEAINTPLPECTMYEYILNNNKNHLNDVAIVYFGRKICYEGLFFYIDQTAAAFVRLGVKKGDIVTISALSLPQVIFTLYALSKIGAVANFVYANIGAAEVKENLNRTGSRVWVVMEPIFHVLEKEMENADLDAIIVMAVQDEMDLVTKTVYNIRPKEKILRTGGKILPWKDFYRAGKGIATSIKGKSTDAVVMVYTGGTTGKSKAVMLSNFNVNVGALQYLHLGFERQKTMLCALPPFIAFGITVTIHTPLAFGMKTALCIGSDATEIGGFVKRYKPNYIICGTAQAEKMMAAIRDKNVDLSFLHCLSVGGDVLPEKLERQLDEFLVAHHAKIQSAQGYAMSETSASTAASTRTIDKAVWKKGTIGVPLVYTNVKIVDLETDKELGYGQNGEICLNEPCTMMGYYKNQEETDNILRMHKDGKLWLHTGDIGSVDEDGFITITGRIKRIILTFENDVCHKVFPKLLEDEFLKNGSVKAISIVGKERAGESLVNDLVAFVVLADGVTEETAKEKLRKFATSRLQSYERPCQYVFVKSLPRTTIGKIDYRVLEERAENL